MDELHYDPGLKTTAICKSAISDIDGERGRLRYRGYSVEELLERSSFLEVAYLLIYGELPNCRQLADWTRKVNTHTFVHVRLERLLETFNYDAHPMGMFISTMAAMSTFHAEANPALQGSDLYVKGDEALINKQILRILGKTPTLAAAAYRHRIGRPFNLPPTDKDAVGDDPLSYTRNFLVMLDKLGEEKHRPHPELVRALDQMFILHAEHEMNCSTAALRHIASSRVDPYSAIAGAAAACYGPLHGGANEAVLRMLERDIGSVEGVGPFLARVKARQAKLMGFGHRVYRSYDPRAQAMGGIARRVFAVCFGGTEDRLWQVAQALERAALEDDYFVSRRLYPNVDFYSGLIYRAMGFPTDYFPLLFVVPRVAGWLAHWREGLRGQGEEAKIFRPRAIYVGVAPRPYLDVQCRGDSIGGKDAVGDGDLLRTRSHPFNRRYLLASKY